MTQQLELRAALNYEYVPDRRIPFEYGGEDRMIFKADYDPRSLNIQPKSDPHVASTRSAWPQPRLCSSARRPRRSTASAKPRRCSCAPSRWTSFLANSATISSSAASVPAEAYDSVSASATTSFTGGPTKQGSWHSVTGARSVTGVSLDSVRLRNYLQTFSRLVIPQRVKTLVED